MVSFHDRKRISVLLENHNGMVFTRYIILEWIRRNQNDQKRLHEEKSVMS